MYWEGIFDTNRRRLTRIRSALCHPLFLQILLDFSTLCISWHFANIQWSITRRWPSLSDTRGCFEPRMVSSGCICLPMGNLTRGTYHPTDRTRCHILAQRSAGEFRILLARRESCPRLIAKHDEAFANCVFCHDKPWPAPSNWTRPGEEKC
jgi:hypothetical protein